MCAPQRSWKSRHLKTLPRAKLELAAYDWPAPHGARQKGTPYDFRSLFSPETLDKARSNDQFKNMVASVAFSAIKQPQKVCWVDCDLDEKLSHTEV